MRVRSSRLVTGFRADLALELSVTFVAFELLPRSLGRFTRHFSLTLRQTPHSRTAENLPYSDPTFHYYLRKDHSLFANFFIFNPNRRLYFIIRERTLCN